MNHFQDYIRNYTFSSLLYWRTTHKYIWKERHSDFPVSLLLGLFVCRLHSIRLPLKTLGHNLQAPYVEDSFPISPVGLISPICLLTALKPCQISNSFGINHKDALSSWVLRLPLCKGKARQTLRFNPLLQPLQSTTYPLVPRRDQDNWICLIQNTAECFLPSNSIPIHREAPRLLKPSVLLSAPLPLRPHLTDDLVLPSFKY